MRQTKVNLVNRASAQLREEGAGLLSAGERAALAFAGKTEILMACERYERRAISRRNRALQALAKLQRELRREEAIEVVGPPRPKLPRTRHIPFREQDVLRLEVEQILRSSPPMERVNFSCTCEWQPHKSMVGVHVTTEGDRGFLELCFQVNGKPIAQTFELAGSVMRVGGVRWTVKCPESGKMVRDLYLVLRPNHTRFRSRHALGLSYRTSYLKPKERYGERAWRLMDRLGATEWREPPIRPKNMQRRTFKRLVDELWDAWLRDASANLGVSLDRDALENFGSAELDDIAERVTISPSAEGAASRRINECHRGRPASLVRTIATARKRRLRTVRSTIIGEPEAALFVPRSRRSMAIIRVYRPDAVVRCQTRSDTRIPVAAQAQSVAIAWGASQSRKRLGMIADRCTPCAG